MGFTIEDMMLVSHSNYEMRLVAGQNGWSNSISWLLMLEDLTIISNFSGKEIAVTTGLGFQSEDRLMELIHALAEHHASGLIINTGKYIHDIPEKAIRFCDENDFPLMTVPWRVQLADMIKDLSIRVFLQSAADEQIAASLIHALEYPEERDRYTKDLLPYFDVDGTFQIFLITTGNLDKMDTVERKRIGYRMQLYLTNITHNSHFFYYDSYFVMVANALNTDFTRQIILDFQKRVAVRMPEYSVTIGVGSQVNDILHLHTTYQRARSAVLFAQSEKIPLVFFDEMGIDRLLYSVSDRLLLEEMSRQTLAPLLRYDREHHGNYVETLENYLRYDGSIQAVASAMFIHRNTITYRIKNIKKILGSELNTTEEKMHYQIACRILHMIYPK